MQTLQQISTKPKKITFIQKLSSQKILHLMILPSLIIVLIFKYIPIAGIVIAFKDFDIFEGIIKSPWAKNYGFEHFIDLFKDPYFPLIFKNTIIIAFLKLTFLTLPPVILAIMLNEVKHESFKKVNQTISYLPHFISWIVLGGMFYNLFDPTTGPVNKLLMSIGLASTPINFLYQPEYFRALVVVSDVWKTVGWDSIIYIAVIASIDQTLYEAIDIDGGGRWAKIRYVIWPSLLGTFMILFIIKVGKLMAGNEDMFEQCYIFGNFANQSVSEILDTYILKVGLENARYSYAGAAGIVKSFINLSALLITNYISQKLTEKSLF